MSRDGKKHKNKICRKNILINVPAICIISWSVDALLATKKQKSLIL
jgi:hypothetical protein